MKKVSLGLVISFFFFSCSKETQRILCLKVKVIGYDYCFPATMGAQILEGPHIGEAYGNYDNVISIEGVDQNKIAIDSILYMQLRDKKEDENLAGICLAVYPNPVFSRIHKVFISSSSRPCN